MRGDSIRDLYAKTLALLGLGMLAGTGALVDYWPSSGGVLPLTAPAFVQPLAGFALPAPDPELPVAPVSAVRVASARVERATPELPPVLALSAARDFVAVRVVALNAPPPAPLTPVPMFESEGQEISFSAPDPDVLDVAPLAPVALSGDDGSEGFFTAAFKRTGSSIARTGAKTGASFMEMIRVVNRTVRRALPD